MVDALWTPSAAAVSASRMTRFREQVAAGAAVDLPDYPALWRWSVEQPGPFWSAVWDYCGVRGEKGAVALENQTAMPGARWFPEARLNYAENLLQRDDEHPALVFRGEDGRRSEWSFATLRRQVAQLQRALRLLGVGRGDRVAGYLPNLPEAVAAMLASASLGAVWSSCSPDFGVPGVVDRFGQIEPKVLFAADGYLYKGRVHDTRDKLEQICQQLPSLERVILVPFADPQAAMDCAVNWQDFLDEGGAGNQAPQFEALPFDAPLFVMFSSGTTGKPKCIVHGHGGTLLQHLKEHQLHTDLRPGERLFYFTTTGWMMWNWLVSALASGVTVVLYDGNPFYPGAEALWRVVDEEAVEVFGTSAKFLDACKKAACRPREDFQLSALRAVLSTGSPLVPESFDWVYHEVKQDLLLASIAGGTDLISCFVLGNPVLPVVRGQVQCRGLGMAVEVWDEHGQAQTGAPGELVCTRPFPSMPVGFWNDADGQRYHLAYFDHFPGVWRHGDWVELTANGGMVIYGRSDATLNPGGVRIGTAEIYRQVEQIAEVEEAIVVGQDTGDGDQQVVLFVRLAPPARLDATLAQLLRARIRANATPRHVPAVIAEVSDIPRTRSGKISEIAVRDVLHGRPVKNTKALANPEALAQFEAAALTAF